MFVFVFLSQSTEVIVSVRIHHYDAWLKHKTFKRHVVHIL